MGTRTNRGFRMAKLWVAGDVLVGRGTRKKLTSFNPDTDSLVGAKQCHKSHWLSNLSLTLLNLSTCDSVLWFFFVTHSLISVFFLKYWKKDLFYDYSTFTLGLPITVFSCRPICLKQKFSFFEDKLYRRLYTYQMDREKFSNFKMGLVTAKFGNRCFRSKIGNRLYIWHRQHAIRWVFWRLFLVVILYSHTAVSCRLLL